MTPRQDLLFPDLPADQANRFQAVAEAVRQKGSRFEERPHLLDVGGYPGTFARRFRDAYPRWNVTTFGTVEEPLPDYKWGSPLELPFADNAFHVVVSCELLPMIDERRRRLFLSELCRVSSGIVILAAPFHHTATAQVSRLLEGAHQHLFRQPHPTIPSIADHPLASLKETIDSWPDTHGITAATHIDGLESWFLWQLGALARKARAELDNLWPAFNESCASNGFDVGAIPYRTMLIAEKGAQRSVRPAHLTVSPDLGDRIVELARLLTRLVEAAGAETTPKGHEHEPAAINKRLEEALENAEQTLRFNRQSTSSSSTTIPRLSLKGLFGNTGRTQ